MRNKRSAVLTAGGLAASFMAGAAAVTFHWGMGTSSASTVASAPISVKPSKPLKPIVKHRTIVIHRKAPSPPPAAATPPASQTVVIPAPAVAPTTTSKSVTTTGGSATTGGENEHEHEGSDD
ncbi:MAG TPA: hypothetical protein VGQ50_06715 [Actinomycetota bacterium]|nr:hypothetical protein [Actinomycetota bacterium]